MESSPDRCILPRTSCAPRVLEQDFQNMNRTLFILLVLTTLTYAQENPKYARYPISAVSIEELRLTLYYVWSNRGVG